MTLTAGADVELRTISEQRGGGAGGPRVGQGGCTDESSRTSKSDPGCRRRGPQALLGRSTGERGYLLVGEVGRRLDACRSAEVQQPRRSVRVRGSQPG